MWTELKNNIKVLMLLDVGGTMDDHIECTEELSSAAKTEFKNMGFFTSITASTITCRKTIIAATASGFQPGTSCASTRQTPN